MYNTCTLQADGRGIDVVVPYRHARCTVCSGRVAKPEERHGRGQQLPRHCERCANHAVHKYLRIAMCARQHSATYTRAIHTYIQWGRQVWCDGAMGVLEYMCQPVKDIYPVEMVPVVLYPSLAGLDGYTCRHTHARARTHTAAYFLSAAPAS